MTSRPNSHQRRTHLASEIGGVVCQPQYPANDRVKVMSLPSTRQVELVTCKHCRRMAALGS